MRSFLIIGLGRFGRHLAKNLAEMGNEVFVTDRNEKLVEEIAPYITSGQICDCTDIHVLRDLGVGNFDVCFVCISNDLESSMVISTNLKELGAKKIVTKVNQDLHVRFLLTNGADEVIYPERDMAMRTALRYSAKYAVDYIQLSESYGIFEIEPPESWLGRTIMDVDVRRKYQINIIAQRHNGIVSPIELESYVFTKGNNLLVAGDKKGILELVKREK